MWRVEDIATGMVLWSPLGCYRWLVDQRGPIDVRIKVREALTPLPSAPRPIPLPSWSWFQSLYVNILGIWKVGVGREAGEG